MPEKKLYDLTVDPEFRDLIPPLNEEELKLLEESLVADGCESPLIVWNGVIIDGHNRYAICRKHDIPFSIQEKNFETREEVMLWMLRNQLGRRNLNNYQRIVDTYGYGQRRLQETLGLDDEAIYELDGYMDFEKYGQDCMENDCVTKTEFGLLRRLDPPFPEQRQGQRMM